LDVNHHASTIDVADFEAGQLGIPQSGGIERHQYGAVVQSVGRINELSNFFLAENRG
jgi:hypothetical protein